ncbi:hypothetical protein HYT95_00510 [Candidatus Peregrinibacteria bacterium]|nr:hypothetical protein [Candidatus Peregrinibacteria bacterium]
MGEGIFSPPPRGEYGKRRGEEEELPKEIWLPNRRKHTPEEYIRIPPTAERIHPNHLQETIKHYTNIAPGNYSEKILLTTHADHAPGKECQTEEHHVRHHSFKPRFDSHDTEERGDTPERRQEHYRKEYKKEALHHSAQTQGNAMWNRAARSADRNGSDLSRQACLPAGRRVQPGSTEHRKSKEQKFDEGYTTHSKGNNDESTADHQHSWYSHHEIP